MIDGSDNNDISVTIVTSQIVPEAVARVPGAAEPLPVEFGATAAGNQPDHQVRLQPLPRRGLGLLHDERLLLADQHREGASGLEEPHGSTATSSASTSAGRVFRDKLFFFGLYPARHGCGRGRRPAPPSASRRPLGSRRCGVPLGRGPDGGEPPGRARTSSVPAGRVRQNPVFQNVIDDAGQRRRRSRPGRPMSISSIRAPTTILGRGDYSASGRTTPSRCATHSTTAKTKRNQQLRLRRALLRRPRTLIDTTSRPATRTSSRRGC